jgi:hypothetical protein
MAGIRTVTIRFTGVTKDLDRAANAAKRSLDKVNAGFTGLGKAAAALGPAAVPALAAVAASVVSLGGVLASAGAAAGVFGAVVKSAFGEVQEASKKTADIQEKIELLEERIRVANATGIGDANKYEKKRIDLLNELRARWQQMPPELEKVTLAYNAMKHRWKEFVEANKPATYGIMASGFGLVKSAIGQLQPLFDTGAYAAYRLVEAMKRGVDDGALQTIAKAAGPALHTLTSIIINTGKAIGGMFSKIGAAQGQGILEWIEDLTEKWAKWATADTGGINDFIKYVNTEGPKAFDSLDNLATAAKNIYEAVSPLAPVTLAVAQALTGILAAIPPETIQTLVGAWLAFNVALKAFAIVQGIATAAQWAMNLAMTANPIGVVIVAIGLVIAGITLLWQNSEGFRKFWIATWDIIKKAALAVGTWFKDVLWGKYIKGAWNAILNDGKRVWNWLSDLPGKIERAFLRVNEIISAPFRAAFNFVARHWNSTVGQLSFSVPGWVPGWGGNSFAMPRLPERASGGPASAGRSYLVGERGPEILTMGSTSGNITPNREIGDGFSGDIILNVDLGHGIEQVIRIKNRELKRRAGAYA